MSNVQVEEDLIQEYFQIFDKDGDGKIDKDEFQNILKVFYKNTPDKSHCREMFKKYDSDKSDNIEFNEFKEFYMTLPRPEGKPLKDLFNEYDQNHDQYLEFSEVRTFMQDLQQYKSDDQIWRIISENDLNKDGKVDFTEFCTLFAKTVEDAC